MSDKCTTENRKCVACQQAGLRNRVVFVTDGGSDVERWRKIGNDLAKQLKYRLLDIHAGPLAGETVLLEKS